MEKKSALEEIYNQAFDSEIEKIVSEEDLRSLEFQKVAKKLKKKKWGRMYK